ncbi:ABC transporter substrate-binding protein [Burkholderia cenocepacia]|uniref:ABC transporter substrate-binding protein n=1 Tax=Burkholderia cenocepacia TaxID=95486 RepID=UPI00406D0223
MSNRRAFLKTGIAVGAAALAPALASAATDTRRQLRVGMSRYPVQIDPVMLNDTATRRVSTSMFDTLIAFDHANKMQLKPALATSWQRVGPDALRLNLRKGVRFHDGREMTAADVAFSLSPERLLGPNRAGQTVAMQTLQPIIGVDVIDDHTVVVRTSGPDLLLEQRLAGWSSEIISKRAFNAAGSWAKWLEAPVGTGPYAFVSKRTDVVVKLKAFDEYWAGRPPFRAVDFMIIPEASSRVNALLAGDVDIITDVAPDQFSTVRANSATEIAGGAVQNIRSLAIDTTGPILRDARIRRAMSLAIDRKLLIDSLWEGRLSVPRGWQFASFGDYFIAEHPAIKYDPDAARKLLAEAKYTGTPISYRLLNDYYPNQVSGAQAMIAMWKSVGLNVEIHMMENFSQIQKAPINAIYDNSTTAILQDHMGCPWRVFGPQGELTTLHEWSNKAYIDLGRRAQGASDKTQRRQTVANMLDILDNDMPAIVLHSSGQFYGKRKDINWRTGQTLDMNFGPGWVA